VRRIRWPVFLLLLGPAACARSGTSSPSPATRDAASAAAADHAELLRLHDLQRTAHLEKRADLLVAAQADSMLSVSRGRVSLNRPAETRAMFQSYFDASTFEMWEDAAPPVIRVSPDGGMAYVVVEKRVHLSAPDSAGRPRSERTRFAWLEVYEKRGGRWAMTAIASTDRPDRD
jgi:hypothetical protein